MSKTKGTPGTTRGSGAFWTGNPGGGKTSSGKAIPASSAKQDGKGGKGSGKVGKYFGPTPKSGKAAYGNTGAKAAKGKGKSKSKSK